MTIDETLFSVIEHDTLNPGSYIICKWPFNEAVLARRVTVPRSIAEFHYLVNFIVSALHDLKFNFQQLKVLPQIISINVRNSSILIE